MISDSLKTEPVLEIEDDDGFAKALQLASPRLVVVDFFATWYQHARTHARTHARMHACVRVHTHKCTHARTCTYANRCGPCKALSPLFATVASKTPGVKFLKVRQTHPSTESMHAFMHVYVQATTYTCTHARACTRTCKNARAHAVCVTAQMCAPVRAWMCASACKQGCCTLTLLDDYMYACTRACMHMLHVSEG